VSKEEKEKGIPKKETHIPDMRTGSAIPRAWCTRTLRACQSMGALHGVGGWLHDCAATSDNLATLAAFPSRVHNPGVGRWRIFQLSSPGGEREGAGICLGHARARCVYFDARRAAVLRVYTTARMCFDHDSRGVVWWCPFPRKQRAGITRS
jgi:hypothetical protein